MEELFKDSEKAEADKLQENTTIWSTPEWGVVSK